MSALLAAAAHRGRWLLVAGLLLGVGWPGLATALTPLILPLIGALLFLAALRIGPAGLRLDRRALWSGLRFALIFQFALPLAALAIALGVGVAGTALATGVILSLAAPPLNGAPGLAVILRAQPEPALRQVVIGTVLLPVTVLPVLAFLPAVTGASEIGGAVARLLALILIAGGGGLVIRGARPSLGEHLPQIDGLMAIAMMLVVIALMSAIGPALRSGDPALPLTLLAVFAVNYALQAATAHKLRGRPEALPLALCAGNRNFAIFLAVVPTQTAQDLLLFTGCFQVPMYLTPALMGPVLRRL
ncbi:MAG: hypothetical protein CSA72_08125 [Rhodobacterales bacterium]|nr:MAG: hypothetical protein CSA72_08125 [Rhodobacterales bacterium]